MLLDPERTKKELADWIAWYFQENGPKCSAVIGISGGKDSAIVAALCKEALGKDRVVGVLMPNGVQPDILDAYAVCHHLDIPYVEINIGAACDAMEAAINHRSVGRYIHMSEQAMVNMPARVRMATLYAVSQSLPDGGRVANTCNYSEDFVGYATKFGDGAGDFSPLARLTVEEVRQIGHTLDLPGGIVDKTPSDGLCGASDEENLGFTYRQLDDYIGYMTCGNESVDKRIRELHNKNLHKLEPIPYFQIDMYEDIRESR